MAFIGAPEVIFIVIIVVILFFGKDKIIDWAGSLGQVKKEYEDAAKGKTKKKTKKKKK